MIQKVGILTTSYAQNGTYGCNYGAALQGYALVKQLRLMGMESYDINYNSAYVYNPQQYSIVKRYLMRVIKLFNLNNLKSKYRSIKNKKNISLLYNMFLDFIMANDLIYEKGKFFTFEELKGISDSFDAFITGSDVVWNPYLHKNKNDEGFFLDFAKPGVKRIAYAPSIGVTIFPESAKGNLKELLLRFNSLSIRETAGANLIRNITGIEIPVVVDPTLLLSAEQYDNIAVLPENTPEEYILVYKFGDIQHTQDTITNIAKYLRLPIIYVPAGQYDKGVQPRYDIGPKEFVGLIKKARIVLTDSFHCTVFCLLYHTPFYTFYRSIPRNGTDINSRIVNILDMVNLRDRLVLPGRLIDYSKIDDIDFDTSDNILSEKRRFAKDYLYKALQED